MQLPDNINVVWQPLKGNFIDGKYVMSSQELALSCPADILFLSSSRGAGKTEVSLILFAQDVGKGYGESHRGVYIDKHYADLMDVIERSKALFPKIFGSHVRFYASKGDLMWKWDTGEMLRFAYAEDADDYTKFHGQEFDFILWNEITKQATPELFDLLMSTNRNSFVPEKHPYFIDKEYFKKYHIEKRVPPYHPNAEKRLLPPLRNRVVITTNPSGIGHQWVKERFVDVAPTGSIHKIEREIYNPQTKKREIMIRTQCHIFSSYKENYFLSPDYIAELEGIKDPELRKAWLNGDWNILLSIGYFQEWRASTHVIKPFKIPQTATIYCGLDWGWSKPSACVYFFVANGEDLELADGTIRHTVKGDIFVHSEYYSCVKGKPNTGLQLTAVQLTQAIICHEKSQRYDRTRITRVADNAIFNKEDDHCIADEMSKPIKIDGEWNKGLTWIGSDKRAGSRAIGWNFIRELLSNSFNPKTEDGIVLPRENRGIFISSSCANLIRTLPALERDPKKPDDIDTNGEDHLCDALRYVINYILWDGKTNKNKGLL